VKTAKSYTPYGFKPNIGLKFMTKLLMETTYTTIAFKTWAEYKNFVSTLSENWAFRGQQSSNWDLRNAIERTDFIHIYHGIEMDFLSEFQRGARNYLNKDETPEHIIEWLALMQHHGAPTRLLDFTRSPFIAPFFAFEKCAVKHNSSVAIWAMNIKHLRNRSLEVLAGKFADDLLESKNLINEKLFEKIFVENKHRLVFPVEPFRMNRRYSVQQSVFVSTGTAQEPFMEQLKFLGEDINKAVIKIELPAQLQKEVLRDLQRMNLNQASLFPDLDGYAGSLRLKYESMRSPQAIIQQSVNMLEDKNFRFFP